MIQILIYLLIIILLVGLIWWVLDALPVPDPLNRIAKIVVIVIGVLAIIVILLQFAGVDIGPVRRL
jgi:hypothetical protein